MPPRYSNRSLQTTINHYQESTDPLQINLKRLDDMQGQITSLSNKSCDLPASQTSVISEEGEVSDEELIECTLPKT